MVYSLLEVLQNFNSYLYFILHLVKVLDFVYVRLVDLKVNINIDLISESHS